MVILEPPRDKKKIHFAILMDICHLKNAKLEPKLQKYKGIVVLRTQVKMEDAQRLLKIRESECPDVWVRLPRHKWPNSWANIEDLLVPLERHSYGHPLAGLSWERLFDKDLLELGWEEVPNLGMYVRSSKTMVISVRKCG